MCENHCKCGCDHHNDGLCAKLCGFCKLMATGIIFGSIVGMVSMYFFDKDERVRCNAKKVIKGAEDFTHKVQSKISEVTGQGE